MKTLTSLILALCIMIPKIKSQNNLEKVKKNILTSFEKQVVKDKKKNTGLILIHSDSLNIHWKAAAHHNPSVFVHPDQPYHFASIGKTVTSIVVAVMYEKNMLNFNDPISKYLDNEILNGLHIYKGIDYSKEITIKHLLNHTSGLADFYLDKNKDRIRLIDLMINDANHFWTPVETINWAKQQLKPKFKPGNGFHYSDTNYELLGLIIERITGKPLHEIYQMYIFGPLHMDNSYMFLYAQPKLKSKLPIVDFYYNNINLIEAKSVSLSHASGGVISTSEDMLKFIKSITACKIIKEETFVKMCDWSKMGPGGHFYGSGLMKFSFLMQPKKYEIWGNSGSIGAIMYYNPAMDIYFIGSFNKLNYQFQPIIFIVKTLKKISKHI